MISVTSWWIDQSLEPNSKPHNELLFVSSAGDTLDLSDLVSKWPSVKRKAGEFTPSGVQVEFDVSKLDQRFQRLQVEASSAGNPVSKYYAFMGRWDIRTGYIHPTSGPEMVDVFAGRLAERTLSGGKTTLKLAPAAQNLTAITCETTSGEPWLYGCAPPYKTLAECAWAVCSFCGLDPTASTANTDIDYASFSSWEYWVDSHTTPPLYASIWSTGQMGAGLLKELMKQGLCVAGVGGNGKLRFKETVGIGSPVAEIAADLILDASYREGGTTFPNRIHGWAWFQVGSDQEWTTRQTRANSASVLIYGAQETRWKSGAVSLATPTPFRRMLERRVNDTTDAVEKYKVRKVADLVLPFWGMVLDVGDVVTIEDTYHGVSSYHWTVLEVAPDQNKGRVKIKVEERIPDPVIWN